MTMGQHWLGKTKLNKFSNRPKRFQKVATEFKKNLMEFSLTD